LKITKEELSRVQSAEIYFPNETHTSERKELKKKGGGEENAPSHMELLH